MKRLDVSVTTALWVFFACLTHLQIAVAQDSPGADYEPPLFRQVLSSEPPNLPAETIVRLLTDSDFAPFSFTSSTGAPAGLSVELAVAACAELVLRCTVTALPFAEIMPALARGEGDAAIAGPRLDEDTARQALATRPFFRTMGRFATLIGNPIEAADVDSLAGKRIGAAANSVHARWLDVYYADSEIVLFEDAATAGDALRNGKIDVFFGDNVQLIYWTSGQVSGGCCRLLGGAYSDFDHFSRNLVFLVQRQNPDLRQAFDYGLDTLQKNGTTARIIKAYFPLSPW